MSLWYMGQGKIEALWYMYLVQCIELLIDVIICTFQSRSFQRSQRSEILEEWDGCNMEEIPFAEIKGAVGWECECASRRWECSSLTASKKMKIWVLKCWELNSSNNVNRTWVDPELRKHLDCSLSGELSHAVLDFWLMKLWLTCGSCFELPKPWSFVIQ